MAMPITTEGARQQPAKKDALKWVVRFTQEFIDDVPPPAHGRDIWRDRAVVGLLLRVYSTGKKAFYRDYHAPNGRRATFRIADAAGASKISLAVARARFMKSGEDPANDRKQQKLESARKKQNTPRALLDKQTGTYWIGHLKARKSGERTRMRLIASWSPFLDVPHFQS